MGSVIGIFIPFFSDKGNILIAIFTFFVSVVSLVVIVINIKAITNQNNIAVKNATNERFKNAIDQLGNEKNAIVLGAIYTLHRIAKEDKSYIENVFNILCAYVRDTTTDEEYQKKYKDKPSEVIQTILNILCLNKEDIEIYYKEKIKDGKVEKQKLYLNFSGAYLSGAMLFGAHLAYAHLIKVNLSNADLREAELTEVWLTESNLIYAVLNEAYLTSSILINTNLTSAILKQANLTNTNLEHSILTNANLDEANLTNTNLYNAILTNAKLTETNLTSADLYGANLTSVDLWKANLTSAWLWNTTITNADLEKTILKSSYSDDIFRIDFEYRIRDTVGKKTDLSGIKGGFDPNNPPYKGTPKFEILTREEADKIIADYKKATGL